jgi:glycosyltransferase involved in cell wall biosynthesis
MRACDGLICSTEYIARRYARFNPNVYVCRNGLDVGRYALTIPQRPAVNIGWAGATGHAKAVVPWLHAVIEVMREDANVCFVSIGEPRYAEAVAARIAPQRAIGIPFCPLECYPAAMCTFDIALAPAEQTAWYRGKSDLRWLEAGALGIPIIADPAIYPEIVHGHTGFHARNPSEVAAIIRVLVNDPARRREVGENARRHVHAQRTSETAAMQWSEVCRAVAGEYESMHQLSRGAR